MPHRTMIWLPAIYTFTPPFDVATLANPKTPQRSPEWRYGLVSKDCNQHMHWNSWSQWIYVWIHLQQYFDCNSSQWKTLSLKSQALMTSDTDTKSTPENHLKLKSHALMIPDTDRNPPQEIHWFDLHGKNPKRPSILSENHKAMLCNHPRRITAPIRNSHNPTRIHLVFLW